MDLTVVILAAGKGTRMRSALPKVLHKLADKPLVQHVIDTAKALNPAKIVVVYGHGGEIVPSTINDASIQWVEQKEQLGTGHAVAQAVNALPKADKILVLYGDVPLVQQATLQALTAALANKEVGVSLLTAVLADATGYGRIVRDANHEVVRIVEQKDASEVELQISEVNTGILAASYADLKTWLGRLGNNNAQGEYYLTDVIGMSVADGKRVEASIIRREWEMAGVNNKKQLAELERQHQRNIAEQLMEQGVTLMDPARIDVRGKLTTGRDVLIDVNNVFIGDVVLGENVQIGPNCTIKNCRIGDDVHIYPNSVLENSVIEANCDIGPFARIRPDSVLKSGAKVGNFVEVKKSTIGHDSKVNHLSYIGDTTMGDNVNIGAGTITCNYDGANKYQTIIEDDVFVGSDTQLVAPVTLAKGTTIGAGSTITKDTPAGKLTLSRSKQMSLDNWQRPVKKK
ncbi:MAG: bifunctional UDP-N-acetylglucosamine diphosphorylase/glucosamine-1-phosphate N-acetyltransferase GlmU [Gammaproteobacteria bacterium]|nr:bifunctional UDP-N-acetylglucosamine diphosphorylase/glucosamine-1-phosphate N-acetyltransferase GlmU [Gammaproteobacteria bacterium]